MNNEDTTPRSGAEIAADVMRQLGCSCNVEPTLEEACVISGFDIKHVSITALYHFAHAPACVLGQLTVSGMN